MTQAEVRVTGLRELRSALRKIDKGLLPELRDELKDAANIVSRDVQSVIPKQSGKAAASVRAVSGGNTVYIKAGGARVPYYGWLDFGGKLPDKFPRNRRALSWGGAQHPSMRTAGAVREKQRDGRYLYPAIKRNAPKIVDAVGDAVENAARKAGFT